MNRFQILKFSEGQPCPGHKWESIGGRPCPIGKSDCSQTAYKCQICNTPEYGDPGDPSYIECSTCPYMKKHNTKEKNQKPIIEEKKGQNYYTNWWDDLS